MRRYLLSVKWQHGQFGGGRRTKPSTSRRSSACSIVSVSPARSRATRQSASPASISSLAPAPGGSERTPQTPPPQTKKAFCQFRSIAGTIRQSSSPRSRSSRRRRSNDVLERLDAIPQPGRLLVAQALSQMRKPRPHARQRPTLEKSVELLGRAPGKRAGGERSPSAARHRAELGRCLGDDEILAPTPQVEAVLLPAAT
jgi:hypothetical protein